MHETPPVRVRDVLLDDGDLARRARTTLAGSDWGTLSVIMGRTRRRHVRPVAVYDDDGEPVLVFPRHGPAAEAATCRGLVAVDMTPPWRRGVRVRLVGRLTAAGADHHPRRNAPLNPLPAQFSLRRDQVRVRLSVEAVHVGCPFGFPTPDGWGRQLPLALYAMTPPDYLAAHAPRMARYLNTHHCERLRQWTAQLTGRPLRELAAATITDLDSASVTLRYVDGEGGRAIRVHLDPPASTVEHLAATLTRRLRAAADPR